MAARNLAPVRALVRELVPIVGTFTCNGSSAISASTRKGLGWSVARTGVGTYVVTLADKFADYVCVTNGLELATPATDMNMVQTINVSARTVTFTLLTGGVATESAAGDKIHFCVWARNSAVSPTRG